jgi:hypothetical protein
MRKFLLAASAAAALLAGPMLATPAAAAPAAPAGIAATADTLNLVDHVQYVWGGRRYCWYPLGWHGPGWYWCGYGARVGLGWGGPVGWRGWVYRPGVVVRRGPVVVHRGRTVVVHRGGHRVVVHRHR